jgi:hypothetical protein
MKHRSLRPNASSRGCVETHTDPRSPLSQGTNVPRSSCTVSQPTNRSVRWRDTLFPRHLATT